MLLDRVCRIIIWVKEVLDDRGNKNFVGRGWWRWLFFNFWLFSVVWVIYVWVDVGDK